MIEYKNLKSGMEDLVINKVETVRDLKKLISELPDTAGVYCLGANAYSLRGRDFITFDTDIDTLMENCEGSWFRDA